MVNDQESEQHQDLTRHVTELSCDCSKQKVVIESDSLSPPPQFYTKTQRLFSRV